MSFSPRKVITFFIRRNRAPRTIVKWDVLRPTNYNNVLKTKDIVKCSDLFIAMQKILAERATTPNKSAQEGAVQAQPPALTQFNLSPSKSGERLVS